MSRREVGEAIAECAAVIEAYRSPVHYALPVTEEQYQADKQKALAALAEQRPARPVRDGGP